MDGFYSWLLAKGVTPATARGYSQRVKTFNNQKISFADFVATKADCANNTINAYIKALRRYGEYIGNSELRTLKYLPKNSSNIATMSDKEIELFLEADDAHPTKSLFFAVLAYTGMRPIEVNSLEVGDINFADNSIRILATKTQTYRTIPIPEPIKEVLKDRCNEVDYKLFAGYSTQVLYYHFHKRLRLIGIKRRGLHVYSLRHSYATRMVDADADPFSVKELLGHKDLQMTEKYYHLSAKRLQKVAQKDPMAQSRMSKERRLEMIASCVREMCSGMNLKIEIGRALKIEVS